MIMFMNNTTGQSISVRHDDWKGLETTLYTVADWESPEWNQQPHDIQVTNTKLFHYYDPIKVSVHVQIIVNKQLMRYHKMKGLYTLKELQFSFMCFLQDNVNIEPAVAFEIYTNTDLDKVLDILT